MSTDYFAGTAAGLASLTARAWFFVALYNALMQSLIRSNRFLRDPARRRRMLESDARQSSIFEGARGLDVPGAAASPYSRRAIASAKKSVKAA